MSPLQRFQVLLTPDQVAALRQLEQRTGTSMGAHIRLALDRYLGGGDKKPASRRAATRRKA